MRFKKKPGQSIGQSVEDPSMVLIGLPDQPRDVRAPQELGGGIHPVIDSGMFECPCGRDHRVHTLIMHDLIVFECDKFLWARRKHDS